MDHYICKGGCKGVAQKPGVCQTATCSRYQKPLERCDCTDGQHKGAFEADTSENKQSEV